jgi:hypothetical protein
MNFKFLPWKQDQWFSKQGSIIKYDKLEHFLLSVLGVVLLVYIFNLEILFSSALIFMIGIIWEIRDGVIKNGQGFSKKDLIADFLGIMLSNIIKLIF